MALFYQDYKVGIIGGGQLGRMLIQAGVDFNIDFNVLDPDPHAPCSELAPFTCGSLTDHETVLRFGRNCDLITIEIENVSTTALKQLAAEGKLVFPQPHVIEIIQDKRTQKEFYRNNGIPTADFMLTSGKTDVIRNKGFLPAVNKLGKEGYDGRGVKVMRTEADLEHAFDSPGLLEKLIDFDKEVAVITARNEHGDISCFPMVEMVFHPEANLVEYLLSPARVEPRVARQAEEIANKVISSLGMIGVLAVEMFITRAGDVLVNEVAPRPHNSGHQTIEANMTSQYEQHLRAILGLPLGPTDVVSPSAMVNLLGDEGYSGVAKYVGLEQLMAMPGVHLHLYGKKMTKPFRKMGHVTIVGETMNDLIEKVNFVKTNIKVRA